MEIPVPKRFALPSDDRSTWTLEYKRGVHAAVVRTREQIIETESDWSEASELDSIMG